MLPQLLSVGRSGRCVSFRSSRAARRYHADATVAANTVKSGSAKAEPVPLISKTFSELLADQVAAYPHKDTYESATEDLKWTTHQLAYHSYALTGGLHSMPGLPKNGYTAQGPLRAEVLVGLLGAPRAGRVFTVIPPFRKEQMITDLKKSRARVFLFFPKVGKTAQLDEIYDVFPPLAAVEPTQLTPLADSRVPELYTIVHPAKKLLAGMLHYADFPAPHYYEEMLDLTKSALEHDEVSTMVLSEDLKSFAAYSQSTLINTANAFGAAVGTPDGQGATLNCLMPSTAQGITAGLLMPIVRRSKMVVPSDDPATDIPKLYEAIAQSGVSNIVADAAMWHILLKTSTPAQAKDFARHIKTGVIVGNNLPIEADLLKSITSTLGVPTVHTTYGSHHTSGIALVDGKALANSQVKLVDQHGKDTTRQGFLAVKGANVFQGYYDEGKVDSSFIKAGWVVTSIKAEQTASDVYKVLA